MTVKQLQFSAGLKLLLGALLAPISFCYIEIQKTFKLNVSAVVSALLNPNTIALKTWTPNAFQ